jgi:hypothetical protein
MSDAWTDSHDDAQRQARTLPQAKGAPPHWLRCTYFKDGARCVKPDGHSGEHERPK